MTWGKNDDGLHEHDKFRGLSATAIGIWTVTRSWSSQNETDGFIPADTLRRKVSQHARGHRWAKIAQELVDVRLWDVAIGGYMIHDFADWNETKAQKQARRTGDARRQRDARAKLVRSSCDPRDEQLRRSEDEAAVQSVASRRESQRKEVELEVETEEPPTVVPTTAVAVPATRWRAIATHHDRDSLDGIMAGFRVWYREATQADISDRSMPKWRGQVETGLRMGHPPDRCRNALAETVRRELGYGAFLTVLESIAGAGAPAMSTATTRASVALALADKFDADDAAATTGSLRIVQEGDIA